MDRLAPRRSLAEAQATSTLQQHKPLQPNSETHHATSANVVVPAADGMCVAQAAHTDLAAPRVSHLSPALNEIAAPPVVPSLFLPPFKMKRGLKTVIEAWREYKLGLNGACSVEAMCCGKDARWRSDATEERWFNRRKGLYKVIKRMTVLSESWTTTEAAAALEQSRLSRSLSLTQLCSLLGADPLDELVRTWMT